VAVVHLAKIKRICVCNFENNFRNQVGEVKAKARKKTVTSER